MFYTEITYLTHGASYMDEHRHTVQLFTLSSQVGEAGRQFARKLELYFVNLTPEFCRKGTR